MGIREIVNSRTGAVIAGSTVLVTLGGVSGAVAATMVTSRDIKDQTIQQRDIGPDAVGSNEVVNGVLGMRDFNDYTNDQINKPGKEGPEGPPGITDLEADGPYPSATQLKEGDNSDEAWAGDLGSSRQQAWVKCAPGKTAISGGFGDNDGDDSNIDIVTSAPTQIDENGNITYEPIAGDEDGSFVPNAWLVEGYNTGATEQIVRPWVVCADVSQPGSK